MKTKLIDLEKDGRVCLYPSHFERDDKERINYKVYENSTSYIKNYLNIAIHIQHFFELETKRLLENEHVLFAVAELFQNCI